MKPVLIVAPHFAPQTHAAVFRAHKLAKYLPERGWKPYVLTVDTNYLYNEDLSLLNELPADVEIVRVRYIEPSVRGARMALGGRDRTFTAMKSRLLKELGPNSEHVDSQLSALGRLGSMGAGAYGYLQDHWLYSPDAYWTWERAAIRAGRELTARHGIEVVLSTAMPYTAHRVGRTLQGDGLHWVADFRDPAGYGKKMTSPSLRILAKQRAIVRETLAHADAVTTTANSYAMIFTDLFGEITRQPIQWIPTGVDEALISNGAVSKKSPYILYVGEVMPEQTDTFFQILARAFRHDRAGHRLMVVGHELLNRQRLTPVLERLGLTHRVEFADHMPQREVYRLIAGARAGVLAPGRASYWWNNHAKLVDYVGLQTPVVAFVPDPSEARSVLTKAGLGIFLDGDDDAAARTLTRYLDGELQWPEPVVAECERYLARRQVDDFAGILEGLTMAN